VSRRHIRKKRSFPLPSQKDFHLQPSPRFKRRIKGSGGVRSNSTAKTMPTSYQPGNSRRIPSLEALFRPGRNEKSKGERRIGGSEPWSVHSQKVQIGALAIGTNMSCQILYPIAFGWSIKKKPGGCRSEKLSEKGNTSRTGYVAL